MKLMTIWTLPGMALRERCARTGEWMARTLAAHLPRSVQYWATIHATCRVLRSDEEVPAIRVMDVLQRTDVGDRS